MLFFIVFLIVFGVVIYKFLPETKNKTFEEINRIFQKDHDSSLDEDQENSLPLVGVFCLDIYSNRVCKTTSDMCY